MGAMSHSLPPPPPLEVRFVLPSLLQRSPIRGCACQPSSDIVRPLFPSKPWSYSSSSFIFIFLPCSFRHCFISYSSYMACSYHSVFDYCLIKWFVFIPISNLNSSVFLLSSRFTLRIILTQLFSATFYFYSSSQLLPMY